MTDLGAPVSPSSIRPGLPVVSKHGHAVGEVHVVVGTADTFDALVVAEDDGLRVVAAEKIHAIHEHGVVLRLDANACHRLPRPDAIAQSPGLGERLRGLWGSRS